MCPKLVLPSNESYESKTGCNRTLPTVLWVPLSLSCHGLLPFLMGRNKPHKESGRGVQQGYNITSNETTKNVLETKMPQGLVLVK